MNTLENSHITVAEAIAVFRVGRTKLYQLISSGEIRAVKLGRRTLIPAQSAIKYFEDLPTFPTRTDTGGER